MEHFYYVGACCDLALGKLGDDGTRLGSVWISLGSSWIQVAASRGDIERTRCGDSLPSFS